MAALTLDAENLSVTVAADLPLPVLQAELRARGLCYPPALDLGAEETVGAHLARASCGPWRLGRGTARDWVLSLEVVTSQGDVIRTGSGVIKNVAGLDLTKLMIGSQGRLGTITSAILRLAPLPAAVSVTGARFSTPGSALEALPGLLSTPLNPGAVELDGTTLSVGLEGSAADLERRTRFANLVLKGAGGELIDGPSLSVPAWEPAGVTVRAGLPAGRARPWVDCLPPGTRVRGHAGSGIYYADLPPEPELLRSLQRLAQQHQGYMVIESEQAGLPPDLFTRPPAVERIEAAIHRAFEQVSVERGKV